MYWALVKDGIVNNVVVWDGESAWTPPAEHELVSIEGIDPAPAPGWLYEDGLFSEPAPPPEPEPVVVVPPVISDRQFYQQLAMLGICSKAEALDAVKTGYIPIALQTILDTVTDEDQHFVLEMLLSGATQFERAHPATTSIGYVFGWTDEQIDDFFIAAAQL